MVVRCRAANSEQLSFLRRLQETDGDLDFWTDSWRVNQPVDIHLESRKQYQSLAHLLHSVGVTYHIKINDLGKAIEEERQTIEARRLKTKGQKAFDLETYHPYEEIVAYLQQLAVDSPLVSVSTAATTYENRSMIMATISTGSNPSKPVIVFDCAVHAREWAAPSTCLWFINEVSISQSNC